ncbi:hypothetical protein A7A08_03011 [Methyloligella halotolerans]|uniref:Uncharacterized protein n=1 Tax=Methyloligella halotolerans TaxID=1177755 RepID=A0A1E2RVP0_9HYPH|nr:hypothetical protein A7A08_03011 [Methyloligella halotolerans]
MQVFRAFDLTFRPRAEDNAFQLVQMLNLTGIAHGNTNMAKSTKDVFATKTAIEPFQMADPIQQRHDEGRRTDSG